MTASPTPREMAERLMPCPFCGGLLHITARRNFTSHKIMHHLGCDYNGDCLRMEFNSRAEATEIANRRASLSAAEKMAEALRPFAKAARELDDDNPPDLCVEDDTSIEHALYEVDQPSVGDLRKARTALADFESSRDHRRDE